MSGTIAEEITSLLTEAFAPTQLEVINDSAHHAGHSGDDGSGESHFTVVIESEAFAPMSRLARQRAVIAALLAGLETIRSGEAFNFLRMPPINGAFLRPRLFSGLSKSSSRGYFQLDLACLTR